VTVLKDAACKKAWGISMTSRNFAKSDERQCCVYDAESPSGHCEQKWFALGRCRQHWRALRNLSPSERAQELGRSAMPVRERWSYENPEGERELMEKYGQNDELESEIVNGEQQ
jgi:hypothetical protein